MRNDDSYIVAAILTLAVAVLIGAGVIAVPEVVVSEQVFNDVMVPIFAAGFSVAVPIFGALVLARAAADFGRWLAARRAARVVAE